jgi:hypothetical protein
MPQNREIPGFVLNEKEQALANNAPNDKEAKKLVEASRNSRKRRA